MAKISGIAFFWMAAMLWPCTHWRAQSCAQHRAHDSLVLLSIYNKLSHKGITANWDFSKPIDKIDPIRIRYDSNQCRLIALELSYYERPDYKDSIRFAGNRFPVEITKLGALQKLILYGLNIKDSIPQSFFELKKLEELDLSANNLMGRLDHRFTRLENLKVLLLYENQFSQIDIPGFFAFKKLEVLSLRHNLLSIPFPREIGRMQTLRQLYLGFNNIYGRLPEELSLLRDLEIISIIHTKLDGTIPIFLQDMPSLVQIILSDNNFDSIAVFNSALRSTIDISRNSMTFDDIIPFVNIQTQLNPNGSIKFSPQKDTMRFEKTVMLDPGQSYEMEIPFDRNVSSNRYEWRNKNGIQGRDRKLLIPSFSKAHEGQYICTVSNQSIPTMRIVVYHHTLKCKPQIGHFHAEICEGQFLEIFNRRFDKNHTKDTILLSGFSRSGCDSLVYVNIKIKPKSRFAVYEKFCEGGSFEFNQQRYFLPGVYQQILKNQHNCDSTITLYLDWMDPIKDNAVIKIDDGSHNGSIELYPTQGVPPYKYLWSTGSTKSSIYGLRNGSTYSVTITDYVNCTAEYSYKIGPTLVEHPQRFQALQVFPNPAMAHDASLRIALSQTDAIEGVSICDIQGRSIPTHFWREGELWEVRWEITLSPGVYLLEIRTNDRRIYSPVFLH